MRKVFTLAFSLMAYASISQTPITLNRSDFPCPSTASCGLPDSVMYTNVPIAGNSIDVSITGASQSWSMVPLTGGTTAYQNFYPMSATPLVFQLVFLSCDYAQPLLGNTAVGALPVTDAYEYYNYAGTSSSRLEIKGFGAYVTIPGTTTPVPLPAIYSSPDVVYQFPITFGNTDSSVSGYEVTIPLGGIIGDVTFKRNQKRVNVVDGWGSIVTPAGNFDVLRVKSSIDRVDSLITALAPIGFPSKPIEHKWLGKTKKIPVFQTNGTDLAGTFTPNLITFWGQAASGLNQVNESGNALIYPNPTDGNSTIQYELKQVSDVDILILDMQGKMVGQFHFKQQSTGNHSEGLPLGGLPKGNYLIQCKTGSDLINSKLVKF